MSAFSDLVIIQPSGWAGVTKGGRWAPMVCGACPDHEACAAAFRCRRASVEAYGMGGVRYLTWYDDEDGGVRRFNHYGCRGHAGTRWDERLDEPDHPPASQRVCPGCRSVLPTKHDALHVDGAEL